MSISTALQREAWLPESDLPLVLLTLNNGDMAAPIRVVNDRESITSNGNEFIAFPFEIRLPDSLEDGPPRASLRIDNVSREIGQTIRTVASMIEVTIQVVRRATPNIIEIEFSDMLLKNVRVTALSVEGELEFEDLSREPYPAYSFSPAEYPGLLRT